jgi:hypothetical protein
MLYLPGIPPFYAYLADLSVDAEGDGRVILYAMKFVEADSGTQPEPPEIIGIPDRIPNPGGFI